MQRYFETLHEEEKVTLSMENENILTTTPVNTAISLKPDNEPDIDVQNALTGMLNTSSEGLKEIKTENGIMVDLEDRFRSVPVGTINEKGEVFVQDYNSSPKN